jgi:hypothetical protein
MRWALVLMVACGSSKEPVPEPTPVPLSTATVPRPRTIKPPSREHADAFAKQFAAEWARCRHKPLVDHDVLVARALTRKPVPELDAHTLAAGMSNATEECPPQFLESGVIAHLTTARWTACRGP